MSGLGNIILSTDEGMGEVMRSMKQQDEARIRPNFLRPAYQYTELEDKINGSFKQVQEQRDY